MQVLDGILDGDDVLFAIVVDLVEHRRQRRGLARSGGTGHQHQAARLLTAARPRRQAELAKAADLVRDQPERRRQRAALVEHVAAEAREALDAEREVDLEVLLELVLLVVGEDRIDHLLGLGRRELLLVERTQHAVDPDLGRRVGGEVEVGSPAFDDALE